jgi:hypothetical protein
MLHLTALLIERTVPGVRKTVKWNSAFYGVKGGDCFSACIASRTTSKLLFPRHLAATGPARRVDVTRRPSCCQFTNLGAPTAADAAPTFHHQYAFLELGRPHRRAPAREAGPK